MRWWNKFGDVALAVQEFVDRLGRERRLELLKGCVQERLGAHATLNERVPLRNSALFVSASYLSREEILSGTHPHWTSLSALDQELTLQDDVKTINTRVKYDRAMRLLFEGFNRVAEAHPHVRDLKPFGENGPNLNDVLVSYMVLGEDAPSTKTVAEMTLRVDQVAAVLKREEFGGKEPQPPKNEWVAPIPWPSHM